MMQTVRKILVTAFLTGWSVQARATGDETPRVARLETKAPRGLWIMSNGAEFVEIKNQTARPNIVRGYVIDDDTGEANDLYEFYTGGEGRTIAYDSGAPYFWGGNLFSVDPMIAVSTRDGNRYLLAVNAGSNSLSIMRIGSDLGLELTMIQPLKGELPCSVTYDEPSSTVAVITCGDSGTLELFALDTRKGVTEATMDAVDLEADQDITFYPFPFHLSTSPADVKFCPRSECLMVLSHDKTIGIQYFHFDVEEGTVDPNWISTPFENPGNIEAIPKYAIHGGPEYDPQSITPVPTEDVPVGEVLIIVTILHTFEVYTYRANTEDGKFKLAGTTTGALNSCWAVYDSGRYFTSSGGLASMSVGTVDGKTGDLESQIDTLSLGAAYNFGDDNTRVDFNAISLNMAVSRPPKGSAGDTFLYVNVQGLAQLTALNISPEKYGIGLPAPVAKRIAPVLYPGTWIGATGIAAIDAPRK